MQRIRTTGISQKVRIGLGLGVCLVFQAAGSLAADDSREYHVFKFGGGVVSAFLIHEAAHGLVALATGTTIDWKVGDVKQPMTFTEKSSSDSASLILNASGLIVQAGGSEVILQHDKIDKNDNFVRGMMLWNIWNPIAYVVDYWFIHRTNGLNNGGTYAGDLQGVERYTSKATANAFSAVLLTGALFQGYRFVKTQSWAPDWLTGRKLNKLNLSPLPAGAMLSCTWEFQ